MVINEIKKMSTSPPHATRSGYSNLNWVFNVTPSLLIASVILSPGAAAKVTLKNMSASTAVLSAKNQLPQETRTPSSMAAWKMASSTTA